MISIAPVTSSPAGSGSGPAAVVPAAAAPQCRPQHRRLASSRRRRRAFFTPSAVAAALVSASLLVLLAGQWGGRRPLLLAPSGMSVAARSSARTISSFRHSCRPPSSVMRQGRNQVHGRGIALLSARGLEDPSANATAAIQPVEPPKIETQELGNTLPFGFYLVGSGLTTIAAVGSFFEIVNKNPAFGVIQPDSPLWLPLLGTFALTGLPSAGWLFFKGVKGFNDWQEALDRMDGYK